MKRLGHDIKLTFEWFENNSIKLNEGKCHLLVAGHRYENLWAVEKLGLAKVIIEKLLGSTIDRNLSFDDHVFTSKKENCQLFLEYQITRVSKKTKDIAH